MKKKYLENERDAICSECTDNCIPQGMIEINSFGSCETWESHCCQVVVVDGDGEHWKPEYS